MHLEASDPSFIDAFLPSNAGRNDRLDRIDRLIDWPRVAAILDDIHASRRPPRLSSDHDGQNHRPPAVGLMRNEAEALFKALGCNLRRTDGLRESCAALWVGAYCAR